MLYIARRGKGKRGKGRIKRSGVVCEPQCKDTGRLQESTKLKGGFEDLGVSSRSFEREWMVFVG